MSKKSNITNLAIFGGKPTFAERLHVGRPNIGDRSLFIEKIEDIFDRRWLTNDGRYVQELEHKLAKFLGVKHCILMCNGTIALEITVRALGMKGEVIVPSFTFIATAHCLQWQQITPVFCDIDPETHNLDPKRVEELITPRTTGIIGVHLWGRPCPVNELAEIAQSRQLKLMFDAAHAFGCSYEGQKIGGFGNAEVFSFHATKFFNTFEGGAITTNDDELAEQIRLMKNFGFSGYDNVIYIGTNGKMSEVSAAMGLSSLEQMEEFIDVNRRNYLQYQQELSGTVGIRMLPYNQSENCNYQYIILEIDKETAGIDRDQLLRILHSENVIARRYFYPGCHRMEPYRSYFPHAGLLLPNTEHLGKQVMSLPTGTAVGTEEIQGICSLIDFCIRDSEQISEKLNEISRK